MSVAGAQPDLRVVYEFQSAILERLLGGMSAREVLDFVCLEVERRVEDAFCSIMVRDDVHGALRVEAAPSFGQDTIDALDGLVPGELAGSCGTAVHTGEACFVADTLTDPRWASMQELAQASGVLSCWSVPIRPGGGDVLGSFAISRTRKGLPSAELITLLDAGSSTVGFALQRLREERQSMKRDELLRAAVETTEDCIWIKDRQGFYAYVNQAEARTAGHDAPAMLGLTDAELYDDRSAWVGRSTDESVLRTRSPITYVATFEHDGSKRTYHIQKSPQLDENGDAVGVIGIARDITEQSQVQSAMQHAQKLESLGLLASGIAHDFNNILVGILGNAEWLAEVQGSDPAVRQATTELKHAAVRATELTRQMLSYAGKATSSPESVDLRRLLDDVLNLVRHSVSRNCDVRFSYADSVPSVHGDPVQLRQVMMNVLVNAAEASEEDVRGVVDVHVEDIHIATEEEAPLTVDGRIAPGHYVQLTIRDDGVGMDRRTLDRMFDPFYSTKDSGRGLGLAAALGIVKSHGGAIAVESTPGSGTRFRVFLPVTQVPDVGKAATGDVILVVDDEPIVRTVTRRLLESADYSVITAAGGTEAMRLFDDPGVKIDGVVVDQNMPGMSGLQVAKKIDSLDQSVPVLLVTGGGDAAELDAVEGRKVLTKPYSRDELLAALLQVLGKAPRKPAS